MLLTKTRIMSVFLFHFLLFAGGIPAQQIGSQDFKHSISNPAYVGGKGPVVFIDEAHHNFHTIGDTTVYDDEHNKRVAEGRYRPFAELLKQDGYKLKQSSSNFTKESLDAADVLVISNALAETNISDWSLPNPSAFEDYEIDAVRDWVFAGGALLLIADHMPFPGAAADLAASFGLLFCNGYATKTGDQSDWFTLSRADNTLVEHAITSGRNPTEKVESIMTFTGQAFRLQPGISGDPLMILDSGTVLFFPTDPFEERTNKVPRISAHGMLQGVTLRFGEGRIAVFGEAAMFTAQTYGEEGSPIGMNHPGAEENAQFVLNVLHWLTGLLDDE